MPLADILKAQSRWTWNIMLWSRQLGEMIREDGITSVNLATINEEARLAGLDLYIMSNQGAHLERTSGADWQWGYSGIYWLVQSKRLDVVPARRSAPFYTINVAQLQKLVNTAKAQSMPNAIFTPAYVFYNSMSDAFPFGPEAAGCTFIDATKLLGRIGDYGFADVAIPVKDMLEFGALPWYMMFGS